MSKKRIFVILTAAILFALFCAGTTYALLMSRSPSVVNTFVSGDIKLTLTESTGSVYTLVPGCTIEKDPRITVMDGSEECWLFFKVDKDTSLDSFVTYSVADGWTALAGVEGVYWRRVEECEYDKTFALLEGHCITVSEDVTEESLASLNNNLKLTFSAYAVQYEGITTPNNAWEIIKSKEYEA